MTHLIKAAFVLTIILTTLSTAIASVTLTLEGPELTNNLNGFPNSGLQLTATKDVTLDSFIFQNQGKQDTIWLKNSAGDILQTYDYTGGENSHQIQNITWELKKDEIYTLTAKDKSNGRFISYESFPTFNDHIQINGRIVGSGGGLGTSHWYNFNNFTTTYTAPPIETPVPAALWLFGTGVITLFGFNKTQRKSRNT